MNYLDILLAIPLIWAVYKGFTKGLIFSVASLLALILGIYGSIHFSFITEGYVRAWFHTSDKYLAFLSFTITFVIIVVIVHLVAWAIDRLVKAVALGIVNRLAGVIFNLVKMAFILSVILSLLNYLNSFSHFLPEETQQESLLYEPISRFAPSIFPYLKFDEIKKKLENLQEEDSVTEQAWHMPRVMPVNLGSRVQTDVCFFLSAARDYRSSPNRSGNPGGYPLLEGNKPA